MDEEQLKNMIPEVGAFATFKENFVEQVGAFPSEETIGLLVLASSIRQVAQTIQLLAQVVAGPPQGGQGQPEGVQEYAAGVPIIRG
jgi:hypothetical protein